MRRYAPFNIRFKSVTCLGTALNTLLVLGVLWLVQVPRGAGSSAPLDYVLSQASSLACLPWTQTSGSAVTGQWSQVAQVSGSRVPAIDSLVPTGTRSNQRVTLTMGDVPLTGTLQGNTLLLPVTEVTGHQGIQTWYTSSQSDYNALVAAFTTNAHLSFALANLVLTAAHPSIDSDAPSYDNSVQTAHPYDQNLQTREERMRGSEARVEQQAMSLYDTLQTTLRNDYTKMTALKQLAQQVAQIKRAHRCELRERERKCP